MLGTRFRQDKKQGRLAEPGTDWRLTSSRLDFLPILIDDHHLLVVEDLIVSVSFSSFPSGPRMVTDSLSPSTL